MTGKNRIMIYGPKTDGTYVVEFRTAEGAVLAIRRRWNLNRGSGERSQHRRQTARQRLAGRPRQPLLDGTLRVEAGKLDLNPESIDRVDPQRTFGRVLRTGSSQ